MRVRGQYGGLKVVGVILVVIVLAAIGYPALQRARQMASLSTRHVDVSMHDSGTLQGTPYYDPSVGCRLRLPAGLPAAKPASVPEAQATFVAGKPGIAFVVSVLDRRGKDFSAITRGFRAGVVKSQNGVIEEEGTSDIRGMRTYVITFHGTVSGQNMHSRCYCVDGPDGRLYALCGMTTMENWCPDTFDSAASTLEIGTFAEETPPPISVAPSTPEPTIPSTPVAPAPVVVPSSPVPVVPGPLAVGPQFKPPVRIVPGNVPTGGMTSAPAVGQKVEVWWGSSWWAAKVVRIEGANAYIRYDDGTEESVAFNRVREPGGSASPAAPAESETATQRFVRMRPAAPEVTLDAAIVLLGSASFIDRTKGAEALATMTPDKEHRAGVIAKLAEVWREKSGFSQQAASRALAVWADDATEKAFIDRLITGKKEERSGIFEMLGNRKTQTAAKALAKRLRVPEDATTVEAHLRKMGELAEPAVREILTDTDKKVRRTAVGILQEIGTEESVPALEKVGADPDTLLSSSAKVAIEAIKKRAKPAAGG